MSVLLLTVFVGLVLVSFFVALFVHQSSGQRRPSERDSLMPLEDEEVRIAKTNRSTHP